MMESSTPTSLAVASACFGLVLLITIPHALQFGHQYFGRKSQHEQVSQHYEDEDGTATAESEAAFSDSIQKFVLILSSSVATILSLISAVLTTTNVELPLVIEQWLRFGTWVLIFVQAWTIFVTAKSIERFFLGTWSSLACLLLAIAIPVEDFSLRFSESQDGTNNFHVTFSAVQFLVAVILCFTNIALPRRPDVFLDDKIVDRQYTSSFLGRYTFTWPGSILDFAVKNRGLTTKDLPVIGNQVRASTLKARWDAASKNGGHLAWRLIRCHRNAFIAQWTLQVVTAVTNFLPQIVLYVILHLLEARDNGAKNQSKLWLAALGLGLAVGLAAWLESILFYTVFVKLAVPVYEQLAAIIFAKAIRRKDVKGAADLGDEDNEEKKDDAENAEDNDAGSVAKTKQSTINLIGVDGKRLADFATYNYLFIGSFVKFTTAVVFLVKLIGWIPMFAGLAVPFAIGPITYLIGKRYNNAQELLMKARDRKMAVITEALQGIRQIKFSALEKDWYEKIDQVRKKELKQLWISFCYDCALISNWIFGPAFLSAVALTTYALREGRLSASTAFTTLSVFEGLEMTLAILPEIIIEFLDAKVSAKRVQEYLDSEELVERTTPGDSISFVNATISWPSDQKETEEELFKLFNLDLSFLKGELNVISGQTGSGKSLLLSCIIGEADILSGTVTIPRPMPASLRFDGKANKSNWLVDGAIAYVSQIPWIENASLRDNILFGLPYDEERYKKVLSVCALEKDLEMLTDGDMTDIGANGINLSGGQKWRTSFARALYSRASILVLDDIFSAVDAHVGRQLYEEALTGELSKGRTRILVTHHVALCLPKTKYSVLLENGRVLQAGATEELRRTGLLKDILAHDIEEQRKEDEEAVDVIDDGGHLFKSNTNLSNRSRRISDAGRALGKKVSRTTEDLPVKQREAPQKFVKDEKRETGAVKLSVYREYIKACRGFGYWSLIATLFATWVAVFLGRSYWISLWTRQYDTESRSVPRIFSQHPIYTVYDMRYRLHTVDVDPQLAYFATIYGIISLLVWIVGTVKYLSLFVASIRGSKVLFEKLTSTILHSPLRFLDQTPVGRILNRFTADFNMADSKISYELGFMLSSVIQVISVIIAGLFISPLMIVTAIIMGLSVWYYAGRYLAGAREVKRLESNAKSPIFEQFGSVLTGISTIRAFDKTEAYQDLMFAKINTHCQAYWYMWIFNRWMGFRVNMVGAGFTAATAALVVGITKIDAPLAGFVLSFGLQMSECIIWAVRQYANVELDFNAIERILEYSNLETETEGGIDAPAAWPTKGEIEVDELVAGYADDLPPVLKGLTFSVKQNERIGVVGRTGAGKSSLTLALFRFLEARSGSIHIDGIDLSKIKLYDLRSRLAIIPQDPVLFSGTVRSNLDPFNQHTDSELRDALARVHLISSASTRNTSAAPSGTATPNRDAADQDSEPNSPVIGNANVFKSLSSPISEGGLNLSQGQRQLLCLARAIVSRPKIMVLDEATSSVDMETDALIQQSIREEFQNSTLIVIAHRLSTIADFDRILVMGEGRVREYDSPRVLMEKEQDVEHSVFRDMVEKSGERAVLEQLIFGKQVTADADGSEEAGSSGSRAEEVQ